MAEERHTRVRIESGGEQGRLLTIPPAGARIGRASGNDIVIEDVSLSRFHCRFFYKEDDSLWVCDLGSTNTTSVNGRPVQEQALAPGDVVEIGALQLRVLENVSGPAVPADLGLTPQRPRRPSARSTVLRLVLVLVAVLALILLILQPWTGAPPAPAQTGAPEGRPKVALRYEKIEADTNNIFRYHVELEAQQLRVRVDNLEDGRLVARETDVDPDTLARLARDLERLGFFELQPEYEGVVRDLWHEWRLSLTVDRRTHGVRVLNRLEPEGFRRAREMVENYVRHETGMAALALPPERLRALGQEAYLRARRLFDEREVRYGNLAEAIAAFRETLWYCEELEPKPEFYAEAVSLKNRAKEWLDERVAAAFFQADRAVTLREWPAAARQLRMICELVPDRTDQRHVQARDKLLDVERRMGR